MVFGENKGRTSIYPILVHDIQTLGIGRRLLRRRRKKIYRFHTSGRVGGIYFFLSSIKWSLQISVPVQCQRAPRSFELREKLFVYELEPLQVNGENERVNSGTLYPKERRDCLYNTLRFVCVKESCFSFHIFTRLIEHEVQQRIQNHKDIVEELTLLGSEYEA